MQGLPARLSLFELAADDAEHEAFESLTRARPGFRTSLKCVFSEKDTDVQWDGGRTVTKDLRRVASHLDIPLWRCLVRHTRPTRLSPVAARMGIR